MDFVPIWTLILNAVCFYVLLMASISASAFCLAWRRTQPLAIQS